MKRPRLTIPQVATLAATFIGGCATASTEYVPKDPGRTTFVIKDGVEELSRGGRSTPLYKLIGSEDEAAAFFSCDPSAATRAKESVSDYATANSWRILGAALLPALIVRKYMLDADAELVDAINISNDALGCVGGR